MSHSLRVAILYYSASVILTLVFGVLRLVTHFPCANCCIRRLFDRIATVKLPEDDYFGTAFGWKMLQSVRYSLLMELNRKEKYQIKAPNHVVYSLDGKKQTMLLDYGREDRPLVLSFGSLTCPVFLKKMTEYSRLATEFEDVADFVLVYIEEAHPNDGWRFKNNYVVNQHKSLDERCAAAKYFADTTEFQGQLVVDSIENECSISYAAHPIRLSIITDGQIQYTGGMGPTFYNLNEVEDWLKRWKDLVQPDGNYGNHNQESMRSQLKIYFNKESASASKNNNNNNDKTSKSSNYSRGCRNEVTSIPLVANHCERVRIPRQQ